MNRRVASLYTTTGAVAVIVGGVLSAFTAKQPTTFAMWASAYLVLVAGVAQVVFGTLLLQPIAKKINRTQLYIAYGLFNVGNTVVVASTGMKYAGVDWNIAVNMAGAILVLVGLLLFGWCIRAVAPSIMKSSTYGVVALLVASIPLGVILAHV